MSLLSPLLQSWKPALDDAALIAAYTIYRVKQLVPFCGGRTDYFGLRDSGSLMRLVPPTEADLDAVMGHIQAVSEPLVFQVMSGRWAQSRAAEEIQKVRESIGRVKRRMYWGPPQKFESQSGKQARKSPKHGRKGRPPSQG